MNTELWFLAVSVFSFVVGVIIGRLAKSHSGPQPTYGNLDSRNPPLGGSGILSKCKPAIPPSPPPPPKRRRVPEGGRDPKD